MAADNDISSLIPIWPTRSVIEKSGTQNRRHQPRQPEQEQQEEDEIEKESETKVTDKKDSNNDKPGHIDEYA
jgi:hypothetical protein